MIREEFAELMAIFDLAAEGKLPNLQELFTRSLKFFEHMKEFVQEGSPEEKAEAIKMLTELYKHLHKETQKISQRTGLSTEALLEFSDNPSNYTPEQWQQIQSNRAQIKSMGGALMRVLEQAAPPPGEGPPAPAPKPKKKTGRRPRRGKWKKT